MVQRGKGRIRRQAASRRQRGDRAMSHCQKLARRQGVEPLPTAAKRQGANDPCRRAANRQGGQPLPTAVRRQGSRPCRRHTKRAGAEPLPTKWRIGRGQPLPMAARDNREASPCRQHRCWLERKGRGCRASPCRRATEDRGGRAISLLPTPSQIMSRERRSDRGQRPPVGLEKKRQGPSAPAEF